VPPAVKLAAAIRAPPALSLDILTPRFPTRRPLGLARLILRSQRIQVWLKDAQRCSELSVIRSLLVGLPD
jgi:hypothetical protein